jgi:hypothetical protein
MRGFHGGGITKWIEAFFLNIILSLELHYITCLERFMLPRSSFIFF